MTITGLPPAIRDALAADQPDRPVNDLVTEILSRRYGLPYTPQVRTQPRLWDPDGARLILKLPEPVWAAMKTEAAPYTTVKQVAINALADFYNVGKGEDAA